MHHHWERERDSRSWAGNQSINGSVVTSLCLSNSCRRSLYCDDPTIDPTRRWASLMIIFLKAASLHSPSSTKIPLIICPKGSTTKCGRERVGTYYLCFHTRRTKNILWKYRSADLDPKPGPQKLNLEEKIQVCGSWKQPQGSKQLNCRNKIFSKIDKNIV